MRYPFNDTCKRDALHDRDGYPFVYICKHCGTEYFWETPLANYVERPQCLDFYCGLMNNPPELQKAHDEYSRKWDEMTAFNKKAESKYVDAIKMNRSCQICGAPLKQEKGFFLYESHYLKQFEKDKEMMWLRSDTWLKEHYGVFSGKHDIPYLRLSPCDQLFYDLADIRENIERQQAENDTVSFATRCNQVVATGNPTAAAEIKADSEKLKELILHLIHLENNIYSLEQRLPELYYQRLLNDREIVFSSHFPAVKRKEKLAKQRAEVDALKADVDKHRRLVEGALVAIRNAKTQEPEVYVPEPVKPNEPTLATPGLFNKKKVLAENEALMAKYQADMEKYYIQVSVCEKRKAQLIAAEKASNIQKAEQHAKEAEASLARAERLYEEKAKALDEQSSAITPATPSVSALAAKSLIDQNIAETETLLQKTYAARNELYAYNIVFGKYRNVVALSSFYEYLMSGRCESLEGASGAYNIYEGEIRQNLIIANLDKVIYSLERIEQNQYMLYSELRDINSSLDTMNKTMDKALDSIRNMEGHMEHISENSDVIAHNTAATAFYAKKNAELADALGYMVAFS